ncbi:TPA: hypothetical protein ACU21B_001840 [Mannheimia haemolytica]
MHFQIVLEYLNGAYVVSFATVYRVDVFVRDRYFQTIIEALDLLPH